MNGKILLAVLIVGVIGIIGIQNAFASTGVQIDHTSDWIQLSNGTLTPYTLTQKANSIKLISTEGSYLFNNSTCSFSFYNQTSTSGSALIQSDRYTVLAELNGTSKWNAVSTINNAACSTQIYQNSTSAILSVTKSSAGNGVFQVNYTKWADSPIKISFKAVNQNASWTNYHIGLKETISIPRYVTLGNTTYDLSQHNNTSLSRSWITSHNSQLIKLSNNNNYNMGLGWNNANDIVVHYINGQASLDIDYTYNTPILQPNHIILIDPSIDGSVVSVHGTSVSTLSATITVGGNKNRALIVVSSCAENTSCSVSSVTGAANSFTKIGSATATYSGNGNEASIWLSLAPAVGSNTITVHYSGTVTESAFGLVSLYNVDQTTGYKTTNVQHTNNGASNPFYGTITPTAATSLLIDSFSDLFSTQTPTYNQTLVYQKPATLIVDSTSTYAPSPLANLNTVTFQYQHATNGEAEVIAEIIAQVVPATPTLHVNTLNSTAIKAYWNTVTSATWYELNYTNPFTGSTWTKAVNQSTTSYTVTGLTPNKQYMFQIFAGNSSGYSGAGSKGNYTYPFEYFAKKNDNATAVSGSIIVTNASSSGTYNLSASGASNLTGLVMAKLQNFTLKDAATLFVTNQTLNINASRLSLHVADSDFVVTCPYNNVKDLELFTNSTDGHHITAFSSPTCYSNNTVKWHVYYTANGNTGTSYNSTVKIQVLNNTYTQNPKKFTVNGTQVTTSFVNPWIISNPFIVGTGYQTKGFYFSMNLALNTAYQNVNYTAGFLTFNQSNPIQFPISFSSTTPACSETDVTVTFPTTYTLQVIVNYAVEQKTKTYTGIPFYNAGLGYYASVFKFTNSSKDTITMTASNSGNPETNAVYVVPPNQSCLNTNTNSTIPIIQDIFNFQNGTYGTKGNLGAINVVVLIVLIFSMIGLNRVNEGIGVVVMIMILGGLSYFHIVTFPTVMVPAIALIALVGIGASKKLPWS